MSAGKQRFLLTLLTGCALFVSVVLAELASTQDLGVEQADPGGAPPPGYGAIEVNNFVRVIDGDTIEIDVKGSRIGVGLIGIEAPQGNTACGEQATMLLGTLVENGVRLEEDPNIIIDDRREVRMYYATTPDGRSIAKELVKAGVVRAQGGGREGAELAALEAEARMSKIGCVWGGQAMDPGQLSSQAGEAGTEETIDGGISTAAVGSGFTEETITGQLDTPTAFTFLPDGRALIAEKSGTVRVYKDGALLPKPFIDITSQVNDFWDRGLLGIAVDRDFAQNGHVYLLFTYENDPAQYDGSKTARLIRVTAAGDTAVPGSEEVILGTTVGASCKNFSAGTDCIPSDGASHSIGNVKVANDGTLLLTVGDGASFTIVDEDALRAQALDSLAGKVLHIRPNGEGLTDNPFWTGDASDNRSKVWAYGVRNAYRFNLRPSTNLPYLGDVGWGTWEELNVAAKGANLGWPCYEGDAQQAGFAPKPVCQSLYQQVPTGVRAPLVAWNHNGGSAAATGGVFYTGTSYPEEYRGAYFYADYSQGWIRYLRVNDNEQLVGTPSDFLTDAGGPVDIEMGPDGNLYYLSINDSELRRIVYNGTGNETNCAKGEYLAQYFNNRTLSGIPVFKQCEGAVDHDWAGGGPGNGVGTDNFSARWMGRYDFEAEEYVFTARADDGIRVWVDGEPIIDEWKDQSASYEASYNMTAGEHEVMVEYYEGGFDAVAEVSWRAVNPNGAPVPTITTPSPDLKWKVGDRISYSGTASDPEDGALSGSALSWKMILHHCPGGQCHSHPFTDGSGSGGSFVAPDHGDESYFEIVLTATDSRGKTGKASVDVHPETAQVTLATQPAGLQIVYGGESGTAPLTRTAIVGSTQTISAPSPQGDLVFKSWSDSGAQQHNVTVGAEGETYTATFENSGGDPGGGTGCARGEYLVRYYGNKTLDGAPTLERCEATINNDWGDGSPGPGVGSDDFSARWVGAFDFEADEYVFTATADDGIRVFVDGELLIDAWKDQGPTRYESTRAAMTAGKHTVRVEYYEAGGDALARASWQKMSTDDGTANCTEGKYLVRYYGNKTLDGAPTLERCEATINNDWGDGSPGPGVGSDNFSARWVGAFDFEAGDYRFFAEADDGIRVFVDGEPLIDAWKDQGPTRYESTRAAMTAGEHTVRVEYYEAGGGALARAGWTKVAGGDDTVPPAQVDNFVARAEDSKIGLSWENPSDADFAAVRILRSATGYAVEPTPSAGWEQIYEDNSTSYTDEGLVNGTTYYYTAFARDAVGNWSASARAEAMPIAAPETGCAKGEYQARYFNNRTLSGTPTVERCETTIGNNWAGGGPGGGVGSDDFSARWVGTFDFESGEYIFNSISDDGMRVWIDGELVIDAWRDQSAAANQATRAMTAGEHTIRVEYYEAGGDAVARLSWKKADATGGGVSCAKGEFLARYFNTRTLEGAPDLERCETTIDNNWADGGPGADVGSDNFSARWVGAFDFEAGDYRFFAEADDGIRVFVDGELLIDAWKDQGPTRYESTRAAMTAGEHTVRVEYYENGGGALARAGWTKVAGGGT